MSPNAILEKRSLFDPGAGSNKYVSSRTLRKSSAGEKYAQLISKCTSEKLRIEIKQPSALASTI
jgi:hypothetical protein